MRFLQKRCYLILLVAAGIFYLGYVDHWQVYAKSFMEVSEFCREISGQGDGTLQPGDVQPGSGVLPDNGAQAPEGQPDSGVLSGNGAQTPGDGQAGSGVLPGGSAEMPGDGQSGGGTEPGGSIETIEDGQSGGGTEPGGSIQTPENGQPGSGTVAGSGSQAPGDMQPGAAELFPGSGEPTYMTVEDDYFADAVFIGDSRTVGMYEYGGLEETAAFYASTGLTVYKLFDSAIVKAPGQKKKITVEEALQQNSFAKIYLMVGINEMGTGTVGTFTEKYREVLEHLKELQPDAIIYVQAIMKVTAERSGKGDYINNEGIDARNAELAKLADNSRVFYLDVNPLVCDETGGMVKSYTSDGVHLKAKYIDIWKNFLKCHAICLD